MISMITKINLVAGIISVLYLLTELMYVAGNACLCAFTVLYWL